MIVVVGDDGIGKRQLMKRLSLNENIDLDKRVNDNADAHRSAMPEFTGLMLSSLNVKPFGYMFMRNKSIWIVDDLTVKNKEMKSNELMMNDSIHISFFKNVLYQNMKRC